MPVYVGGAELNVANAIANWEIPTRYFTALPDHYLSREIVAELEEKNIDCSAINYSGERIGSYYLAQGTDLKHSGVIYDRAHSSFAGLKPGLINWEEVLTGCDWFHFSAISPALNQDVAALCEEAVVAASRLGLTVSVDLNYRAKLWQYGVAPTSIMPGIVKHCQVIMGNLWAAETLLGIKSPIQNSEGKTNEELLAAAGESMLNIHRAYPSATTFAYTFRLQNHYWAVLQHGKEMASSREHELLPAIDKVGSGDCFMAGLIYGMKNNKPIQEIIDFAATAAVGKLQEVGDATRQTVTDIQNRMR